MTSATIRGGLRAKRSASFSDSSVFGNSRFTTEECHGIQKALQSPLPPEYLSTRAAFGGNRLTYIEGWRAIAIANEVFGFNGWSSEIIGTTIDFCDIGPDNRYTVGLSCTIRVSLKDGTHHDDVGYGSAENAKTKAAAFEKAKKEAVTDGLKRALRMFGNSLGNCLYNKNYLKQVLRFRAPPNPGLEEHQFYRTNNHNAYSAYSHPPPTSASEPSTTTTKPVVPGNTTTEGLEDDALLDELAATFTEMDDAFYDRPHPADYEIEGFDLVSAPSPKGHTLAKPQAGSHSSGMANVNLMPASEWLRKEQSVATSKPLPPSSRK
ncbi:DNA repair protein rad52 [Dispira parvispora]|uniref:DNA repair protein rad52 n=1 Tax=Dispira parvispora TaxID=1520584 RepID=A0A9W8E9K6_9FUNG|nr:DNA repair protein rad52 [Dispira parvispora]